jgi:uncharacterized membrane protein YfcA
VGADPMVIAVAAATVLVGAVAQRVSGLGFALIAAPLLVLATGPVEGVQLANLLAVLVSLSILAVSWSRVDLRRARILVPGGLVGVVPGVLATRLLPAGVLQIAIGGLVAVGLLATRIGVRRHVRPTVPVTFGAGLASGFMNAVAGIGGPALTVYALAIGWSQESFAATAQVSFAVQSAASLALKGPPHLAVAQLALLVGTAALGLALGGVLVRWVPPTRARSAVVVLAMLGAVGAIVRGAVG